MQNSVTAKEGTLVMRALTFIGLAILSVSFGQLATSSWHEWPQLARVGFGAGMAAFLVIGGECLSRFMKERWIGSGLIASGYALAFFFAYAAHSVSGMIVFERPLASWGLQLAIAAACMLHGWSNRTLQWFSVPFTLIMTGMLFGTAVAESGELKLGFFSMSNQVIGGFAGVAWCTALCVAYRTLYGRFPAAADESNENCASRWMYLIAHELYFVLSACSAIALPFLLGEKGYSPLVMAATAGVLLALSWRSNERFKHAFAGIVAAASAVMLAVLSFHSPVPLLSTLTVPTALIAVGLCYRYLGTSLRSDVAQGGYAANLYVGLGTLFVVPSIQLGLTAALPITLLVAGLVLASILLLKDPVVATLGVIFSALATLVLGHAFWQGEGSWLVLGQTAALGFGGSYLFHLIQAKWCQRTPVGGYGSRYNETRDVLAMRSDKFLQTQTYTMLAEQALALEWVYAGVAFVLAVVGTCFLVSGPAITVAWVVEAVALSVLGICTGKLPHRIGGVAVFVLCVGKLFVLDIASTSDFRTLAFGLVGTFFLVGAGIYGYTQRAKPRNPEDPPFAPRS